MRITIFKYFIFGFTIACLFQNCSVQKRIYQKGYYVSHKKNQGSTKFKSENSTNTSNTDLIASNNNDLASLLSKKTHPADTCGDMLFLNDSTKLTVKVTEISDQLIKYKRCDNVTGPQYTISKSKIAMVVYNNGVKEIFTRAITSCRDSLIMINGNGMLASVIEVNSEVVKYKSCNDLKGPIRELNMSNVGRIRYSDGKIAHYNQIVITPVEQDKKLSKAVRIILGAILIAIAISIVIGLLTIGAGANLLAALYILFLVFSFGFMYSMGWQQNLPFNFGFFN